MSSAAVRPAAGFTLAAALLLCSLLTAGPARASACAGADATDGAPPARAAAVECLTSQARRAAHRGPLRHVGALRRSAAHKARAMVRCGVFSHTPCGARAFGSTAQTTRGYARGCFTVGENLAWVPVGVTPREVVQAWLASREHRANLLDPHFRDTGVTGRVVTLVGGARGELWVQHLGTRC